MCGLGRTSCQFYLFGDVGKRMLSNWKPVLTRTGQNGWVW